MLTFIIACSKAPEPGPEPSLPSPPDPSGAQGATNPTTGGPEPTVTEEFAPSAPTGFDLAAELFSDDRSLEFDIELSEASMQALRDDPFTWVEGAFLYEGNRFEPVGVRLKGHNSFLPFDEKPSIKIKLNHFVQGLDLLGLEELTFNNMSTDVSMLRERVAYRLFREHGLPAVRANHASIRINGQDRGLYTFLENVDSEFLALWYPDPTGTMWEFAPGDFAYEYFEGFALESGPADYTGLQAIASALAGPDGFDAAEPWVDWDQFVDFVAATAVIGQFDSYPWGTPPDNDVHIYFDPADGRMDMIPHGMDEALEEPERSISTAPGLLFQACLASPDCAADYAASVWELQDTSVRIDLVGYVEDIQAQIAPLVASDPARPYTLERVERAQATVLEFVTGRADSLAAQIGGP